MLLAKNTAEITLINIKISIYEISLSFLDLVDFKHYLVGAVQNSRMDPLLVPQEARDRIRYSDERTPLVCL